MDEYLSAHYVALNLHSTVVCGILLVFEIEDNGVGFTDKHRESFDTLYTDHRIAEGGKGFGRFMCLKYFDKVGIKSVFGEKRPIYEPLLFDG